MMEEKILATFLGEELRAYFEVEALEEKEKEWWLIVKERKTNYPAALKEGGGEIVLDGYCKELEMIDFPFRGKPMYWKIYRRRWKRAGEDKHYHNNYELHPRGCKCTKEFGDFLKSLTREEQNEFFTSFPSIRTECEKAVSVV